MSVYIGPSEAQAAADAAGRKVAAETRFRRADDQRRRQERITASRFAQDNQRSRDARNHREPPGTLTALLGWFQREMELSMPEALHAAGIWFDTVDRREREQGVKPVGGSAIGSLAWTPRFQRLLEGTSYVRDPDGDLIDPFRSAYAALRKERPRTASVLDYVAMCGFDWRALIGRPFYVFELPDPSGDRQRSLVMMLPEDVLRGTLESGLRLFWKLMRDLTATIGAEE